MSLTTELLLASLGALGGMALWILNSIAQDIKELSHNVALLNERMAVIVEKVDSHEVRIQGLEKK